MSRTHRNILVVIFTGIALLFLPSFSAPQSAFDNFRPGARAVGLGGSLATQARDPSAIFWNPAILSAFRDRQMLISFNEPFEFNFVGVTQFMPLYGAIGLALARMPAGNAAIDRGTFAWGVKMIERFSAGMDFSISKLDEDWFATAGAAFFLGNPGVGTLGHRWNEIATPHLFDRMNIGLTVNNLPLGNDLFDPSAKVGWSFLFPSVGLLINSGHHFRQGEDSNHLGLGFEAAPKITVFSGVEDFDIDKVGAGVSYTHDNFLFNFSYSTDSERFVLTLGARISPAPSALAQPYYERGYKYFKDGNYRGAARELRKYLFFDLADSASASTQALVKAIDKKLARDRILIDSLFVLTNKFTAQGDFGLAAIALTKILELDSANPQAKRKLNALLPAINAYINRTLADGDVLLQEKKYSDAEKAFKRVLLLDKNNRTALKQLAAIGQIYSELADEHFYRGLVHFRQKNYALAKADLEKALEYKPSLEEAQVYIERVNEKLNQAQSQIQALLARGEALERKGRYIEATNEYLQVLEKDSENAIARARIDRLRPRVERHVQNKFKEGVNLFDNKEYLSAREAFTTVLSIDPNHKEAKAYMSRVRSAINDEISQHLVRAEQAAQRGEWPAAFDSYSQALSLDPQNSRALKGKQEAQTKVEVNSILDNGRAKIAERNFREAVALFENALKLDPSNEAVNTELRAARAKLEEELERKFLDGINLYTLDRYQEAINKWNEVLEVNPKHKGALEYKQQAEERLRALKNLK